MWLKARGYVKKGGHEGGMYLPPPQNGPVLSSVQLVCALHYFAHGSPYNIIGKYGVSHSIVMDSVWYVIEAVNCLLKFDIRNPESAEVQFEL